MALADLECSLDDQFLCGFSGVTGSFVLALTQSAEKEYGICANELLQMCSLTQESLRSKTIVPVFYIAVIIVYIVDTTGDELVGLKLAQHFDFRAFDTLGYLLMHCETIGEALEHIQQFERLAMEHSRTIITQERDLAKIAWQCNFEHDCSRYSRELVIAGWLGVAKKLIAAPMICKSIHFEHACPCSDSHSRASILTEYERILQAPVYFDSSWTGICIEADFLGLPYGKADPRLKAIIKEYAEYQLDMHESQIEFLNQAKLVTYQQLLKQESKFEPFASLMCLSQRALQARFKKIGLTYGELLDEIRHMLALTCLADEQWSSMEIAVQLNFNDQTSFSKAFKRWTGETPRQYRNRLNDTKQAEVIDVDLAASRIGTMQRKHSRAFFASVQPLKKGCH